MCTKETKYSLRIHAYLLWFISQFIRFLTFSSRYYLFARLERITLCIRCAYTYKSRSVRLYKYCDELLDETCCATSTPCAPLPADESIRGRNLKTRSTIRIYKSPVTTITDRSCRAKRFCDFPPWRCVRTDGHTAVGNRRAREGLCPSRFHVRRNCITTATCTVNVWFKWLQSRLKCTRVESRNCEKGLSVAYPEIGPRAGLWMRLIRGTPVVVHNGRHVTITPRESVGCCPVTGLPKRGSSPVAADHCYNRCVSGDA